MGIVQVRSMSICIPTKSAARPMTRLLQSRSAAGRRSSRGRFARDDEEPVEADVEVPLRLHQGVHRQQTIEVTVHGEVRDLPGDGLQVVDVGVADDGELLALLQDVEADHLQLLHGLGEAPVANRRRITEEFVQAAVGPSADLLGDEAAARSNTRRSSAAS